MVGIDISNHNGTVDFLKVKNAGIDCIYMKATEGTTYKDTYLETYYKGAVAQGFNVGFYHFLVGTSEPEAQAQAFFNAIKDKTSQLKPCLDIEATGFDIMDYVTRFISTFESLSNLELSIYTGPYYANKNLNGTLAKYACWIAHYGVTKPMATTIWGSSYAGHQYTETGSVDGVNGNVDMNTFTEQILLDTTVRVGWNKNSTGWWYCTNVECGYHYKEEWKQIDGEWYYFDSDGYAKSSTFIQSDSKWYYLKTDCKMAKKEWVQSKNKWYYFNYDGVMATGWLLEKGSWYYLSDDGSMRTGWVEDKENWYYLNSSGKMVTSTIVDGYEIDDKGISTRV